MYQGVLSRGLVLHLLMILLSHLGQAEPLGTCLAGPRWREQYGLGYGCFGRRIFFLPSAQQETVKRKGRTTQRGRSLAIPHVLVRTRTGEVPRCRASHWQAVLATASRSVEGNRTPDEALVCRGDVPTAANLNLYRGWKSCVGWHCDDEPFFGKCVDAKLIVSVSLGNFTFQVETSVLFVQ